MPKQGISIVSRPSGILIGQPGQCLVKKNKSVGTRIMQLRLFIGILLFAATFIGIITMGWGGILLKGLVIAAGVAWAYGVLWGLWVICGLVVSDDLS